MRIVIDMQACQNGSRFRGIGRYTLGIVTAFLKLAKDTHECHLLMNGMFQDNLAELISYCSKLVPNKNIHIWHGISPTRGDDLQNTERRKISEILRETYIEKLNPDVLFLTTYFEGFCDDSIFSVPSKRKYKIYSTCHDLIPLIQTKIYLDPHHVFKKFYMDQVANYKKIDRFLAVSESSKKELIQCMNIPEQHIVNTSEGIEAQFKNSQPSQEKIEALLGLPLYERKVILYFGASDERKNHLKLIKAFSLMRQQTREKSILVLAGVGVGHHYQKFKSYAVKCGLTSKEFCILGRISDKEVIDLYSFSYLFVFPSFHEGFGLPALEAMACGTAVITSNTTSLPEVIGRKDLTFDPYSAIDIKKSIEKFILDENYRNDVALYCNKRVEEFSWEKSASIALNFMEQESNQILPQKPLFTVFDTLRDNCVQQIVQKKIAKNLKCSEKENLTLAIISNFRKTRKPRILYDISKLVTIDFFTGIQRVTFEILREIRNSYSSQFDIIPIKINGPGNLIEEVENHKLSRSKKEILTPYDILDVRPGDIYINIDLDHSAHHKAQAYDMFRRNGCKTYFIVHDLLPIELGDSFFSEGTASAHFRWFEEAAKADALICVSKAVMNNVSHYLHAVGNVNPELQLGWFHLGGNFSAQNSDRLSSASNKFKSVDFNNPVFLMVGSVEPRKGHLEIVEAMSELWEEGYKGSLIIAGARGWNNELVTDLTNSSPFKDKLLFWPESVSDSDLAYLYSKATALIAGSLGEGFGLPLIEAMSQGTNVIARDIPVFKEVTNNSAVYFQAAKEFKTIILNYKKYPIPPDISAQSWSESAHQLMSAILNGQNLNPWIRDDTITLLPICSGRFNTSAGIYNSDRINSNSVKGLLVWGGYFPIDIGSYEIKLYGKSNLDQEISLKVTTQNNDIIEILFDKNSLHLNASKEAYDKPEVIATAHISINKTVKDAEIYVEVSELNSLYISGFEIVQTTERPFILLDLRCDLFKTEAGIKKDQGVFTQNKPGILLHGGDINLHAGKYSMEIFGTSPQIQNIDFSIGYFDEFNTKQILLNFQDLKIAKSENSIISKKTFSINKPIENAELFIDVDENNKLKVSEIKLQKI